MQLKIQYFDSTLVFLVVLFIRKLVVKYNAATKRKDYN